MRTDEQKEARKLRKERRGGGEYKRSAEVREKMSRSKSGENNPQYGKPRTDETKAKISKALSGEKGPSYGKPGTRRGVHLTEETKAKMSVARSGQRPTRETCILMSMAHQGITDRADYHGHAKEKGGRCWKWTDSRLKIRKRVRAFFGNRCIKCGKTKEENGCHLSVNHVGNNRQACCADNPNWWLLVPLCISCHTQSGGSNQEAADVEYTNQINREYGGKCYYTLEEYDQLVKEGKLKTEDYGRRDGR